MKISHLVLGAFVAIALVSPATATDTPAPAKTKPWNFIPTNACPEGIAKPSIHCSDTVTGAFDRQGRLWLAWLNDGRVYVNASDDGGLTFTQPVAVNAAPQSVDHNGENRPKVVPGDKGELYVSYTVKADAPYTGDVFFSRSMDGGASFAAPRSINDGQAKSSLRFESLGVGRDGKVFLVWLDKRDLFAAKAAEVPYRGSAIYYAVSDDRGATFGANRLLAHNTCECCRIAMDMDARGLPIVIWRHIFEPNVRDHAVVVFKDDGTPGAMTRSSIDNWAIDTCPHEGPSVSIDRDHVVHIAWFTQGSDRQGLFYARSQDGGRTFTDILPIDPEAGQTEHPYVLAHGGTVYLAWRDFDGERSRLRLMTSADHGLNWSPVRTLAATGDASDHPFLITDGSNVLATWRTFAEGFRVIAVDGDGD